MMGRGISGRWIFLRDGRWPRAARIGVPALFVMALVVLFPLRIAVGGISGLTARAAHGTIWSGTLRDASLGPFALGSIDAGLAPLPLVVGRREVRLSRLAEAGVEPFAADLWSGGVAHATGKLALARGLGPLPIDSITFNDFGVTMTDGTCTSAQGKIAVSLPVPGAGTIPLSGSPRCDGRALLLPLRGPGGMERLDLRVTANGSWRADLLLAGVSADMAAPLVAMGFTARPGGFGIGTNGKF
jgi:general secretion pathway protein N